MKLSSREIELLADIDKRRSNRRRDAWIWLATAVIFVAAEHMGVPWLESIDTFLVAILGVSVAYLVHSYFAVRPEDKLLDLLQRYVDRDPEALLQIAESRPNNVRSTENSASPPG